MLSEAFLTTLKYRGGSGDAPTTTQLKSSPTTPPADSCVDNNFPRSPRTPRTPRLSKAVRKAALEKPKTCQITVPNSASNSTYRGNVDEYWNLELYRSWCCPSLCKNYPDMLLRGDQLGDLSSRSPQWPVVPSFDGPVLISQDLAEMEGLQEPEAAGDTGPWQGSHQAQHNDDGYMVMQTSIQGSDSIRDQERLSNSMLNGYLETKLLEVYRQHMQDSLARGRTSVSPGLVPAMVSGSPHVLGDRWMVAEERAAPESYLRTCSQPSSSRFSTPDLRISASQPSKKD